MNVFFKGEFSHLSRIHSKKCWVVLTKLWVKYGQTQRNLKMQIPKPNGWVCPFFTKN